MGAWDEIATAPVYGSGNPLGEGIHQLRIIKVFHHNSAKKNPPKEFFIVEFEVLNSTNPTHVAGSTRSWVVNLTDHGQSALSNVKRFVMAMSNCESEQVTKEVMEYLCGEQNPLMDYQVACEGTITKTKRNTDFTVFRWELIAADQTTPSAGAEGQEQAQQ